MHGNLLLAATDHQWQAAHRQSITFRSLQVRAMHKQRINTRNSAHDFSVKISHAYVATLIVAVLTVGICDT